VALLRGKAESVATNFDAKNGVAPPVLFNGPPAMFFKAGSPKRILFLWFFHTQFEPTNQGYRFLGWETVDGHRCLKVQLNDVPGSPAPGYVFYRFWIDLERGGHPLKYEMVVNSEVRARIDGIKLERVEPPAQPPVWMPVTATVETFLWGEKHYSYPLFRETYRMINGTLQVNRKPADSEFVARPKAEPPVNAKLLTFRSEYERPFRTDPVSVQNRLDALLKEADAMSAQLDASAPAHAGQSPIWARTVVVGGVGLVSLGLFTLWRRRR
jgi:MYXO-CTERM domain-containing protein